MAFLESEKLLLRALEPEDLDVLYQWENDTELWQYGSTLTPYSRFALRDYLSNSLLGIFHSRQLRLMIVFKETGKAIGTIDLYDFDAFNLRAGIGILLDTAYRNNGLGAEALCLTREYTAHFLHLKQLYAYVPQSNIPSLKLFRKIGYEETGLLKSWLKTENGFEDVVLMQQLFFKNFPSF
ncbi:MAG: GNAT family N-acetyltransferase [Dysgonamonadaceae bacterium]|jgi:diamine N-acetyltransferase|nr:GNAT family N-acetyltransferase [Dysgonamonadaceae bacterium]